MNFEPRWLIAAWASDGPEKDVSVSIPDLGDAKLLARPCGSVYCATRKDGQTMLELRDGK